MPENHAWKEGLFSHTFLDQVLSSAIAGIVGRICTHPLDTIKANLQAPQESRYGTTTIQSLWRQSSWRSLYRGLSVAIVGGTPGTIVYLTAYEQLKGDDSSTSFFTHFMAGLVAEGLACSIYVPVDVLKERLQVGMYPTPALALSTIFSNPNALRTLYRGYWATLASFGPYSAFYFLFYEESKRLARKYQQQQQQQLSFWWILPCSAGSGAAASFITSPLDLVKLRLQLKNKNNGPVRDGILAELLLVYHSAGLPGLFRGAGARVLHFVPATTIAMTTYETCRGTFL